ncbi:Scr1 family TA system antitoxin-like transcriptional regulator [Streptomyces tubbatahanensis]|uniref:Scr1 family TA system antitoxin-like transcriptional regulator n=1 Tax=Streptomyces tubbatahanensis TaxID=2923272 RepID=A0ABY3XT16_9ACTN|nr:Scr1 family TA system antitoxin-like transcriptional regulator [Streptomyces tubbatahanensis]UNS97579.1 Scr1 family TA system antitoxin-like transcriptional regulator [Streptomyces tubbatahanensis]
MTVANRRKDGRAVPSPRTVDVAHQRKREDDRPGVWVAYGKLLRKFRIAAGYSQETLAPLLGYSPEQVASVEQGRRAAKAAFTEAAERVLNAGGVLATLQEDVDLAKLPPFFRDFVLLEMEAVSRFDYDPLLVPGLLQTEAYARALFEGHVPVLDEDDIDNNVDVRLTRQKLLTKSPLVDFCFVLGEAALRQQLVGSETMREQYCHLLTQSRLRNVAIQVMPLGAGFHPGLYGGMVMVETSSHQQYGYFESQGIGHVVSEPARVSEFALRYGKLRSQALNIEESAAFIQQLAGER